MYCSSCGNQVADSLTYCNRCGFRLIEKSDNSVLANLSTALQKKLTEKKEEESSSKSLTTILQGLMTLTAFVVLGGLGIIIGLVAVLLDKDIPYQEIFKFVVFFLMAVFGLSFLVIHQLSRALNVYLKQQTKESLEESRQSKVEGRSTAQLEEPKEPFISVTENTTRTLDKVLQKRGETQ